MEEVKPVEEVKFEEKMVYPELPETIEVKVVDEIQGQLIMPAFADEQLYELPKVDGDKVCEAPLNES